MRWNEIFEAHGPKDHVVLYTNEEQTRSIIDIGGRRLVDHDHGFEHTLKGINLKNVRSPKGPLLFHGTVVGSIQRFNDESWFSAEPYTAVTHATFWQGLTSGRESYIYVCYADIKNPKYEPKSIQPGNERAGDVSLFYERNPEYDAMIWRNTKDVIMPKTDLYNIKSGSQVHILKKWSIESKTVSDEEFDMLAKGNELAPTKHKSENAKWEVVDPGLTHFESGDHISQEEYEENSEYGLTAKTL